MRRKRPKVTGYLVFEWCDDYEQALTLKRDAMTPPGGVLDWPGHRTKPAVLFFTRVQAQAAIDRTDHYCKAFGVPQDGSTGSLPAKKHCYIKPVAVHP